MLMLELRVGNIFVDIVGDLTNSQWKEIEKRLSFRPQNFIFHPLYNRWIYNNCKRVKRVWDGWKRQAWKNKKRTYFPTGLYSIVATYLKEDNIPYKVVDCRSKPVRNLGLALSEDFVEREYQTKICDDAVSQQRGIIQAPTGAGKTAISAGLIHRLQVSPFLFFVTSIDLAVQARREMQKFLRENGVPINVGQIGGGVIEFGDINVLTVQTAVRALGKKWDSKSKFDADDEDGDDAPIEQHREDILELMHNAKGAICDECLTGDTIVLTRDGPTRINELSKKIGKEVLSFSDNSVVWKKITHFYHQGNRKLLKIRLSNGIGIRCTANHLIKTSNGWTPADRIRQNDLILCHASVGVGNSFLFQVEVPPNGPDLLSDIKLNPEIEKNGKRYLNKNSQTPLNVDVCNINYVKVDSVHNDGEEEVFDITVEDSHCFFANGVLVHNCQHWRSDICQLVTRELKNCFYIYGTSATPYRDEGDDLIIQGCFGKKVAKITASELIQLIDPNTGKPYLMKPHIKMVHLRGPKTQYKQWQSIYKDQVVENEFYNNAIANIANAYIDQGRLVLVLVQQINHGKYLEGLIPGGHFISGKSPKKKRTDTIDRLRNGDIRCIISSTIFDEGIDVKPLDTLILAGQGKSRVRAMQRIGRTLRPFPGKPDPTVIDFKLYQPYLGDHADERATMYATEPEFDIEHIDPKRIFS